jgi:hypothetical protein
MKVNGRKTRDGATELTPTRIAPTTPDTGSTISVKDLESSPTLRSLLPKDLKDIGRKESIAVWDFTVGKVTFK